MGGKEGANDMRGRVEKERVSTHEFLTVNALGHRLQQNLTIATAIAFLVDSVDVFARWVLSDQDGGHKLSIRCFKKMTKLTLETAAALFVDSVLLTSLQVKICQTRIVFVSHSQDVSVIQQETQPTLDTADVLLSFPAVS